MRTLRSIVGITGLLALSGAIGTAAAQPSAQTPQPSPLTGIVGNWASVNDGGAALKVDGAAWDGATDRARLESHLKNIFGQPNTSFVTHATSAGAFPIAVAQTPGEVGNGTFRVAFKMIGGASDQNAGIMFGLRPNGDYHFVRYNTKDGNVAVWGYVNGERAVLAKGVVEKQLPMNTWHELVVTIRNGSVQGSVAGTDMRVEHTLAAAPSGRVGVWTKRDAITVFRNFRVMR